MTTTKQDLIARQQAPVGDKVVCDSLGALLLTQAERKKHGVGAPIGDSVKPWKQRRAEGCSTERAMLDEIADLRAVSAWKDAQLARARQGESVSKAELWDAIHQYVSDYGDQFRSPPTTGAGKHCDASRDELDATIDRIYATPTLQAQGEPVGEVRLGAYGKLIDWYSNEKDLFALPVGTKLYLGTAPQADEVRDTELKDKDMMLWLSDDNEVYANGPDDFANDYASNCLNVGEEVEVGVDCAYRLPSRTMHIALVKKEGTQDDCEVVWKWIERTTVADNQKG